MCKWDYTSAKLSLAFKFYRRETADLSMEQFARFWSE